MDSNAIVRGDYFEETWQCLPEGVQVLSSTDTNPIIIQTVTPHGATTGQYVQINEHINNLGVLANNGNFVCTKVDDYTLSLNGSVGDGSGGRTGNLYVCISGEGYTLESKIKAYANATDTIAEPVLTWVQQSIFRFKSAMSPSVTEGVDAGEYSRSIRITANTLPTTTVNDTVTFITTPTT